MAPGTGFMLVVVVLALVMAILPGRTTWQVLHAWQFRNPEANEPSNAAHAVRRLSLLFGAVLLGTLWFQLQDGDLGFGSAGSKLRDTVDAAVSDLDQDSHTRFTRLTEPAGSGSYEGRVSQAVRQAAPRSLSVEIESTGDESYTITAEGTSDAYCLRVRETELEPVTDYGEAVAERVARVTLSASATDQAC
ncbi:hypothetical protein QNO07_06000 [Streptomyces sp. 549]|uniref:hypothetical protein n=1 Tax=Streptomyces sp. 549 TaxID=3049076 RepID=UPI0024C440C8|nr:hypothetical protein [Streptomyces sp. 549]MDK1472985.1 hypothetical protein [Streptomyces sp. 549]